MAELEAPHCNEATLKIQDIEHATEFSNFMLHNDIMDKNDEMKLNPHLENVQKLFSRFQGYESNLLASNQTPLVQYITNYESILGVLELGKQDIFHTLSNTEIEELITSLSLMAHDCSKLVPAEKEKFEFMTAKMSAAFKGFELPLISGGAFDALVLFGLDKKEILQEPVAAVKEGILEAYIHKIPKNECAKYIIKKAMGILKQQSIYSDDKINLLEKFITQGDQSIKLNKEEQYEPRKSKIKDSELPELKITVLETANQFIDYINSKITELPNFIRAESDKVVASIIKNLGPINNTKEVSLQLSQLDHAKLEIIKTKLEKINAEFSKWKKVKSYFIGKNDLTKKFQEVLDEHAVIKNEVTQHEISVRAKFMDSKALIAKLKRGSILKEVMYSKRYSLNDQLTKDDANPKLRSYSMTNLSDL